MIDRIVQERKKRYDQLHEMLADPKVVGNSSEYQAYAKEFASLTPIIKAYEAHQKLAADLKDMEKVRGDATHDKEFLVLAEDERHRLAEALKTSASRIEDMILDKDSGGDRGIILEIRAGTGGVEASLFAADLLRMYSRYAAKNGWKNTMRKEMKE